MPQFCLHHLTFLFEQCDLESGNHSDVIGDGQANTRKMSSLSQDSSSDAWVYMSRVKYDRMISQR
jgi:hypothetical protein